MHAGKDGGSQLIPRGSTAPEQEANVGLKRCTTCRSQCLIDRDTEIANQGLRTPITPDKACVRE
jgi:hypothetical protein